MRKVRRIARIAGRTPRWFTASRRRDTVSRPCRRSRTSRRRPPPQGYGQPPVPPQEPQGYPGQQGPLQPQQPPVYAPPPANPYGQVPTNPYYAPPPIVQPPYNGMAIGGFVLACVSLVLCCLPITAIVGLVLSIISMPQIDRRGERGKGLAVAGIVLNALVVLGWLLMFIISLMGSMAY